MLARHGGQGLVVLAVNVGESRAAADAFTGRFDNDFQYRYDPDGEIADALGVDAMPSSILFDREGRPVYRHSGFSEKDSAEYEQHIVSLLDEVAASAQPPLEIRPDRGSGVRPWERAVLARESMRLDADLLTRRAHAGEDVERGHVLHQEGRPCAGLGDYLQVSGGVGTRRVHHGGSASREGRSQEAAAKAPRAERPWHVSECNPSPHR